MVNIDELLKYKGVNPKPLDFDEFWARGLMEMDAIDPEIEIIPSEFKFKNTECFDMYFTGTKGARIHCKFLRPKNNDSKLPALLHFHGYGSVSDDFSNSLSWTGEGYAVFALDCRGQSGLSEDVGGTKGITSSGQFIRGLDNENPDDMLFRQMYLDTVQLAKIVHSFDFIDKDRIYSLGGSQGGALSVACSALSPYIKKSVIIYPFLSDFKKVYELGLAEQAYVELKLYFRIFDPLHKRDEEIFTRLGYIDAHHLAPRITAEVLFFSGLSDNICPPLTQFAVYNNIQSKKDIIVYPDFGHEALPSYFNYIFAFFNK